MPYRVQAIGDRSRVQFDKFGLDHRTGNAQARDADRQLEAARTRAAGIKKQYSVPAIDERPVRVAADHDLNRPVWSVALQILHVMQHVNGHTAGTNDLKF